VSTSSIFISFGVTVILAVGSQVLATRLRIPAIVVLLPVGFFAARLITSLDPEKSLGAAFSPLVSLAVAVILFDGGLELNFRDLEGHSQRVVRRLVTYGGLLTWAGGGLLGWLLLGLSGSAAIMLGAILIVSGPTVVTPILEAARPGRRVSLILGWEGVTIDPIGAIVGALVFQGLINHVQLGRGEALLAFLRSLGIGAVGGICGTVVLWLLLSKVRLRGVLATEAIVATVIGVAALCDAQRDDTGLIAAIVMGVALANLRHVDLPEDRRFFKTVVQLVIGLLFISISATVATSRLEPVLGPTLLLVAGLVLAVRPLVAAGTTAGTSLTARERAFIGWMDPRGIVAASTAATFGPPLAAAGVGGAGKLLPVTFVVIVATVALYGLTAVPVSRMLGLHETAADLEREPGLPDEPGDAPPVGDL
jgi:NhaP-type Na+/H+ or K+/H+ antiporter